MTRSPVSASISSTVKTVSYKMEFPTFLDESVLVATWANQWQNTNNHRAYLSQDIIHGFTRLRVSFPKNS